MFVCVATTVCIASSSFSTAFVVVTTLQINTSFQRQCIKSPPLAADWWAPLNGPSFHLANISFLWQYSLELIWDQQADSARQHKSSLFLMKWLQIPVALVTSPVPVIIKEI